MRIIYSCAALALLIIFIGFAFKPELVELRVNIEKYTQKNIPQNSGPQKWALIIAKLSAQLLPSYQYTPLARLPDEVGVGKYTTDEIALNYYKNISVSSVKEIISAIQNSQPGTVINVMPGAYVFNQGKYIHFKASGKSEAPIILRANKLGSVTFNMELREGILLSAAYVTIENIIFKGAKLGKTDRIDHAIHIAGNADNISIMHNEFINFNSHIKANGVKNRQGIRQYPDKVTISYNNFYNEWKRNTSSPASPIDVVGGKNWLIANNFIADFGKYGRKGRGVTYGLFLKGASEKGIIRNNLVNCEWKVPHTSPNDIRIGISLGNGGTGKQFCMDEKQCHYEHIHGSIINNTILNCKNDVAIYINKGKETMITDNYISNSLGIEVRYPISSAKIEDNFVDGRIRATHGAKITSNSNNMPSADYLSF